MSHPDIYNVREGEAPDSQRAKSNRWSKVTSESTVLLVLCVLLAAALFIIYRLSFELTRTRETLRNLEVKWETETNNLTERLSEMKQCNLVQPMHPEPELNTNKLFPMCEEGWEKHGRMCYYFSSSKSSWNESRTKCRDKGGDLVKVDSMQKQKFLGERVREIMTDPEDRFWIGLTDSAEEGRWLWVDGSPLNKSLTFWYGDEPDDWKYQNPDGEDCVRMGEIYILDIRSWFDKSCKVPHKGICEKPAETGQ